MMLARDPVPLCAGLVSRPHRCTAGTRPLFLASHKLVGLLLAQACSVDGGLGSTVETGQGRGKGPWRRSRGAQRGVAIPRPPQQPTRRRDRARAPRRPRAPLADSTALQDRACCWEVTGRWKNTRPGCRPRVGCCCSSTRSTGALQPALRTGWKKNLAASSQVCRCGGFLGGWGRRRLREAWRHGPVGARERRRSSAECALLPLRRTYTTPASKGVGPLTRDERGESVRTLHQKPSNCPAPLPARVSSTVGCGRGKSRIIGGAESRHAPRRMVLRAHRRRRAVGTPHTTHAFARALPALCGYGGGGVPSVQNDPGHDGRRTPPTLRGRAKNGEPGTKGRLEERLCSACR